MDPAEAFPGEPDSFAWSAEPAPWVPVADGWGRNKGIEIRQGILLDARIPACLSYHPYADFQNRQFVLGSDKPVQVLVPPGSVAEARDLLGAAFVRDGDFERAGAEIDEARESDTRMQWLRAGVWAYLGVGMLAGLFSVAGPLLLAAAAAVLFRRRRQGT